MVCIILCACDEVKAKAKAAGFSQQTILIRNNPVQSTDANKQRYERELMQLGPYQFLVSDFWGAGPD